MVNQKRGRGQGRGRGRGRGKESNVSVLSNSSRINNTTVGALGGLTLIEEDGYETLKSYIDTPNDVQGISEHEKMLQVLIAYFNECQKSQYTHEQLLSKVKIIFNNNDKKVFAETIWRMMAAPFSLKPKRGEPCQPVNFFYKILNNIGTFKDYKESLENSLTEFERKDILNLRILRLAQKYDRLINPNIRFRIAETINIILKAISQLSAELNDVFINSLRETCLLGLNDKDNNVRAKYAESLSYLTLDEKSKTVLFYRMRHDPHVEIRKSIIKFMPLTYREIPEFLDLLGDENEQVQLLAVQALKNYPFARLSINQRERIISAGLKHTTEPMIAATTSLLDMWLVNCEGDPIKFLQKLDVIERKSVCLLGLKTVYRELSTDTFDKINLSFLEDGLVRNEVLNPETVFFWWFLFDYFNSLPFCYAKLKMPIVNLINYVYKLMTLEHEFEADETENGKITCWNIIFSHILKIFAYLNPEEGERRELQKFVRKVFEYKYLAQSFLKPLMELFFISFPCDDMDLAIGDFIQSICINGRPATLKDSLVEPTQKKLTDDEISKIKLKLGELTHEKHKLMTEKQRLVEMNDFLKAHNIQEKIEQIIEEVKVLKEQLEENRKIEIEDIPESNLDQDAELAKYPENTLKLILELLNLYSRSRKTMTTLHRSYYEFYVKKSIVCEHDIVRIRVLEGMSYQGLKSYPDAISAMVVNCQAVIHDAESVKIVAIHGIFDLLLKWGFENFQNDPGLLETLRINEVELSRLDTTSSLDTTINKRDSVFESEKEDPLKILLFTQLKTKNVKMTKSVVRGFLRILLAGQIHSAILIRSFLLLWINPANQGTKLWREISLWLPVYASMGESQAELVAEGLIPTLKRIFIANPASPMADAVPDKLIEFVLKCTDQVNFKKFKAPHLIHEKLSHLIIDELDKLHKGNVSNAYAKGLKWLKLQNCSQKAIKKIRRRIMSTLQLQAKGVRTSLLAFTRYLNVLHPPVEGQSEESDSESEFDNTVIDLFESQDESERTATSTKDQTLQEIRDETLEGVKDEIKEEPESEIEEDGVRARHSDTASTISDENDIGLHTTLEDSPSEEEMDVTVEKPSETTLEENSFHDNMKSETTSESDEDEDFIQPTP